MARYEAATGQMVNKSKSAFVISKHCPIQHVRMVTHLTVINQGSLPMRYLGYMLFKGRRTTSIFRYLIDSIHKRLMGWSGKFLSPGGRLLLIKHVLSSIPIHIFAALEPPLGIISAAEKNFSIFFWGSDDAGRRKRSWRAWSSITYPIDENGLGLRSLRVWLSQQNFGGSFILLSWSRYVSSIHVTRSLSYRRLKEVEPIMLLHTRLLVLDGSSLFLTSNWTGSGPLVDQLDDFPLALQDAKISDLYGEHGWDSNLLSSNLPASMVQQVCAFSFHFIDEPDRLIWEPHASGLFSVASAFQVLRQKRTKRPALKVTWGSRIPVRISIFFWRFLNNLLPFPDVLQSYGFQLPSKCPCCDHVDTLYHSFFDCPIAAAVWSFFFGFFPDLFSCASLQAVITFCLDSRKPQYIKMLPIFVTWSLWRLRNTVIFDGARVSVSWVRNLVISKIRLPLSPLFGFLLSFLLHCSLLPHLFIFIFVVEECRL